MKAKKTGKPIARNDAAKLLGCSEWLLKMKGPRPVMFEHVRGAVKRAILDKDELMKWWRESGTKERVETRNRIDTPKPK